MKAGLAVSALLFAAAAAVPEGGGGLPPFVSPPVPEYAAQDVSMDLAGARRLGGDLAYVVFLQYLGGHEGVTPGHDHEHDHGGASGHSHDAWLPRAFPLALRTLALSPYFHAAHLTAAGALGFVLDRPGEAVALLRGAAAQDPTFWRYRLYAGAISYRDDEQPEKVIPLLEEALKYPDCPSMLQNILASLYKKLGRYDRAAAIYEFTARVSNDPAAVETALRRLEDLRREGRIR
jgi:hypothetical protein